MRHLATVMMLSVLTGCSGSETAPGESEVTSDGFVTVNAGEAPQTSSASNENFARLIAAGGVPERCIDLARWAGEQTPSDRALAGLMEFSADPYTNTAPSWIAELAQAGFLTHEREAVSGGRPVNVYRATAGNESMFPWLETGGNRGGAFHFCPGKVYINVVNYTEPAEKQGMTEARYTYRVSDIPAPIQAMMDSGQIPAGPTQEYGYGGRPIRATVLVEGEGETTLVKTSNGWELRQRPI